MRKSMIKKNITFMKLVDLGQLSLLIFQLSTEATVPDLLTDESKRVLAALTSLLLIMKGYDWLVLFSETAFYIRLIGETIWDIKSFMILFVMSLAMFGIPMVFLNFGRNENSAIIS